MTQFGICTYNYPGYFTQAGADKDFRVIDKMKVTILATQEGFAHGDRVEAVMPGWESTWSDFWPRKSKGDNSTQFAVNVLPIAWDTKWWDLSAQAWMKAFDDTRVGSWGAGPPVMDEGITHAVRLDHKRDKGKRVWVVNDHFPPSVTQNKPAGKDAAKSWEKRRELYSLEIENIIELTRGFEDPVVAVGDYNAPPTFPLINPMEREGFKFHPGPKGGTIGNRVIDLCAVRGGKILSADRFEGQPGDHAAAIYRVEI